MSNQGGDSRSAREAALLAEVAHHPSLGPHGRLTDALPATLSSEAFIADLAAMLRSDTDAAIGPFYRALFDGLVTREGAQTWIKQWYYEARTFPPLVAQVIANSDVYYDARQLMGANLREELGELVPSREHPKLLKKIGAALGVRDEEMEFVKPIPEILVYTEYRHKLVRDGNVLEAIAAGPLAAEFSIPDRYIKIGAALKARFGVSHDALEFLWIHAGDPSVAGNYGGDVQHTAESTNLIKKYATTAGQQDRVRLALWRSLEARKVYQWGLFRACVLEQDPDFTAKLVRR
jgi:pyrroloquinoline quinone (PQQ) biosynthesis protein C